MAQGKIIDWKSDRGFGFVRPLGGGGDVFLHIKDLRHDSYEPRVGDKVRYSLKRDAKGRARAGGVVVAGVPRVRRDWGGIIALLISAGFLASLYFVEAYRPALFVYLGMSLLAFIAYGVDKRRAKIGGWRTPEATLHWIGFLGGWPGAVPAQLLFRHKTRKASFQIVFWLIVAIHVGFWSWLHVRELSPDELMRRTLAFAESISR